jgi:hypothetical protein
MLILKGSLLALWLFGFGSFGQVVIVGGNGKLPKDWCYKVETIRPNLELQESAHILGRIFVAATGLTPDLGAMKNSRVELRKYISQRKQTIVKVITTDDNGFFDMGTVEAGKYRLLASPTRAIQQAADLKCSGNKCELNIGLRLNPTDQVLSLCPVR